MRDGVGQSFSKRQRFGEQVTLSVAAPERLKLRCLVAGFDALSDNVHMKAVCQGQDRFNDLEAFDLALHLRDKRSVDLERLNRQAVQVT